MMTVLLENGVQEELRRGRGERPVAGLVQDATVPETRTAVRGCNRRGSVQFRAHTFPGTILFELPTAVAIQSARNRRFSS